MQQNKEVVFEPFEKKEESTAPPQPSPGSSRRKRKAIEINDDSDSDDEVPHQRQRQSLPEGQHEASGSRMSPAGLQDDQEYIHVKDEEDDDGFLPPRAPNNDPPLFIPDDEDEKPEGKPKLKVNYTGFRFVLPRHRHWQRY